MTEPSEDAASAGIVEDVAALVRKLAETEPYKSASGAEALLALATHLEGMVAGNHAEEAPTRRDQPSVVRVAVRSRRSR